MNYEASMSEREIASILKVSHMSVNRTMRELADMNFVGSVTVGKAHLWKVNRKSYASRVLSALFEDISTIKEPLDDLKQNLLRSLPKALIKRVVSFGSVAGSLEKINSDIDLFILVKNKKNKETLESSIEKLSSVCFEMYGNRLAPYILTEQEMKQKKKMEIISEINKGIQIFPKRKDKL